MWKMMKENVDDLLSPNLWRSLACETVGTLVIVLLGCGAWIDWSSSGPNVVQIALAFGLAVGTMVWSFSHISGGHFNPALTAATLVTRRVSIVRGVLYIVAQILGGILGAGVLYGLTPAAQRGDLGSTLVREVVGVTSAQAFGVEFLITFVYVLSFFASRDSARKDLAGSSPLTVGLAVVVCQLFAVYWVGPLAGGVLAGLLYDYVFSAAATVAKARKCLFRTKKSMQEKPPLDDNPAPEIIEIDETPVEEKEAATPIDSDKTKLTDENAKE